MSYVITFDIWASLYYELMFPTVFTDNFVFKKQEQKSFVCNWKLTKRTSSISMSTISSSLAENWHACVFFPELSRSFIQVNIGGTLQLLQHVCVINDPLGQTQSPPVVITILTWNLFCFARFRKVGKDRRMDITCENSDHYDSALWIKNTTYRSVCAYFISFLYMHMYYRYLENNVCAHIE